MLFIQPLRRLGKYLSENLNETKVSSCSCFQGGVTTKKWAHRKRCTHPIAK